MKEDYQLNKLTKGLTSLAVSLTVMAGGFLSPFSGHAHAAEMEVKVQVNDDLINFPMLSHFWMTTTRPKFRSVL